ncbi:MAG: AraC family transcriptional regulator [Rhodospirillaceae bacterium]|nr:AraC family transcriptional regulator [Rhodospirillaceae bacterium]
MTVPKLNLPAAQMIDAPPRFVTHDALICRDYIKRHTGTHEFDLNWKSNFEAFVHHECFFGSVSVNLCNLSCSGGFKITKYTPASYYSFQFLLEDNFHFDGPSGLVTAGPGDVVVLNPDDVIREFWVKDCLQFVVNVERKALEQAVTEELSQKLSRPLVFEPMTRDPGIANWLKHIVSAMWVKEESAALTRDKRVSKSIESTLIHMLLTGLPHSESGAYRLQAPGAAPFYVKRAEAYIHEHVCGDLEVKDIAAAAGVSTRSLYYGFKAWRSTTPMAYVRSVKLKWVRKELEKARLTGGTVSQIAARAGFTNFSQFSKVYKARYGETPSRTLRLG